MNRIKVVHLTELTYAEQATASYNEARMLPRTRDGQFVLQSHVDVTPAAHQNTYRDFWGTYVSAFEILTPHQQLQVMATSVTDVRPIALEPVGFSWESLAGELPVSVQLTDALTQTNATEPNEDMTMVALTAKDAGADVDATARAICHEVGDAMEYRSGVTGVNSTASEAWAVRSGVCQDIAHVTLGVLREAGIPARYVSGYLHPDPAASVGEPVVGESHAWVEWYAGGWRGYDPTNLMEIGERHVYVGHGRDYSDIAPLRGVYAGRALSELSVSVELTKLG
ncbi:MAG: transglutaminase family protein [Ancrocorticia sp.]|uniref:transglutaminase family protein n=1 Tax=Ancrocorticia sp. TaxID=2593684 RepID=UPI003F919335